MDDKIKKIFHFARFDLAAIQKHMGIFCKNIYCTKIASKLIRTYTDRHGLKELCKELINIDINTRSSLLFFMFFLLVNNTLNSPFL